MANPQRKPMTLEAYLDFEERQPERYEFVDGDVFLMAGSTLAHDTIRLRIAAVLLAKLAGRPCRPHLDVKLVCANGRSRYPDVAVMCGPRDPRATRLTDPVRKERRDRGVALRLIFECDRPLRLGAGSHR